MAKTSIGVLERQEVERLIDRLERATLLSILDIRKKRDQYKKLRLQRIFKDGKTWGEASGDLPIYSMDQDNFFAQLKNTDDQILIQINRFNQQLDQWFEVGESHAPYFPWRIIIILSKCGEKSLERKFLAAYCRHFHDRARRGSRRDQMIVERAIKKGAWDYWPRTSTSGST